jgi:hypothetical protein
MYSFVIMSSNCHLQIWQEIVHAIISEYFSKFVIKNSPLLDTSRLPSVFILKCITISNISTGNTRSTLLSPDSLFFYFSCLMLSSVLGIYSVRGEGCHSVRQCIYRRMKNGYILVIRPDPHLTESCKLVSKTQKAVSHGLGIWHDFWWCE